METKDEKQAKTVKIKFNILSSSSSAILAITGFGVYDKVILDYTKDDAYCSLLDGIKACWSAQARFSDMESLSAHRYNCPEIVQAKTEEKKSEREMITHVRHHDGSHTNEAFLLSPESCLLSFGGKSEEWSSLFDCTCRVDEVHTHVGSGVVITFHTKPLLLTAHHVIPRRNLLGADGNKMTCLVSYSSTKRASFDLDSSQIFQTSKDLDYTIVGIKYSDAEGFSVPPIKITTSSNPNGRDVVIPQYPKLSSLMVFPELKLSLKQVETYSKLCGKRVYSTGNVTSTKVQASQETNSVETSRGTKMDIAPDNGARMAIAPLNAPTVERRPRKSCMRYNTNTYYGSSGSPVFDMKTRQLVALHTRFVQSKGVNEGVLLSEILSSIDKETMQKLKMY